MPLGNLPTAAAASISSNWSNGCFFRLATSSAVSLPANGDGPILRGAVNVVRIACSRADNRGSRQTERAASGFDARHEALEVFLLLVGE